MRTIRLTETEYNDLLSLADRGADDLNYYLNEVAMPEDGLSDEDIEELERLSEDAPALFSKLNQGAKHWTDDRILRQGDEFVGFDEAGQELERDHSWDKVRDALVIYAYTELGV